jgi:P63C domain
MSTMQSDLIPQATHGSPDRPLRVGDLEIPCYVLKDGRRVLVQRAMISALGMTPGGSSQGRDRLAKFAGQDRLKSFVPGGLQSGTLTPIEFRTQEGRRALGYEATMLPDLCDAVLAARKAGTLTSKQQHIADHCEILVRAFARVGIIALVDEATGYQEVRDRRALEAILDRYLRKELAAWAKRFPDEFYQQIFRLKGWEWKGLTVRRPGVVGKYTTDLVYERLAPGIVEELERLNPKNEHGNRARRHHQWLTEDVGHPALAQHLYALMGFMRVSNTWEDFYRMVQRAFPKKHTTLLLPMPDAF